MPTLLDAPLVEETLRALPGWSGDQQEIRREVHLPPRQAAELVRQVEVDAEAMGHHPTVRKVKGGTEFALRTHDVGGVSELDIALASHISDLAHRMSPAEPGVEAVRQDDPDVVDGTSTTAEPDQRDSMRTELTAKR